MTVQLPRLLVQMYHHFRTNFMKRQIRFLYLIVVIGFLSGSSTGCRMFDACFAPKSPPLPIVLRSDASLEEVKSAVNSNSGKMRSFVTSSARIKVSDLPVALNTQIAYEYPKKYRAIGEANSLMGKEFDLGSNEEQFWVWFKRDERNAIYYCRQDQYAASPVREQIPLDPNWLIESMGVVVFLPSPLEEHQLIARTAEGHWEIETKRPTPLGVFTKHTTVDGQTACVLVQKLYDPSGKMIASAISCEHVLDQTANIVYPAQVDMAFAMQNQMFSMQLSTGSMQFNPGKQFLPDTFHKPNYPGYRQVDICGTQFNPTAAIQYVPSAMYSSAQAANVPTSEALSPVAPYVPPMQIIGQSPSSL